MTGKKLTRRAFLTATAGIGVAGLLAACSRRAPGPTTAPPVTKAQEIHFLCRPDIKARYAADKAVEAWNAQFPSRIILDEPAGADVATLIQQAQAAGASVWDGYSVMETPWATLEWVKRRLIAPLDDYIMVSTIPNADKVMPGVIPTIKESVSYEGQIYGIPGNVGSVALAWFWEPLRAAGYDRQPETWDEVHEAARKIKEKKPTLTPFASAINGLCDLYAMIWSAKENPFDADGLIDIRSKESLAALTWMRKMVQEELMPPTSAEQFDHWLKGGIAMITSYDVAGTLAQQAFGLGAADTGINFFPERGKTNAGTPFWINSSVLLNKARNPQGMVDFFLWWFGPDNKATGRQITEVAAKPCYQYTYDEFVQGRKEYEWELKGIELVARSKWFPINAYWGIQQGKIGAYIQECLDVSQPFEPENTMEEAYNDIRGEVARQRIG
jgi:ABC-type glycerol-3-phosphate transport system substrate-binding protein